MNQVRYVRYGIATVVAAVGMIAAVPAWAVDYRQPEVRLFEITKQGKTAAQQASRLAADSNDENGGTIALGNVNGEGAAEVIVGSGPGAKPTVKVYTAAGLQLSEFSPYADTMISGVTVAAGDLNGDGTAEIITGTGKGAAPQVRVFNILGTPQFTQGFYAFDEQFKGGVNVAAGNTDGKKGAEIIAGAGPGGSPHVRVFNKTGEFIGLDYQPFASSDHGGVSVAAANVDGGKEDEVIMGLHSFGQSWVKVYKTDHAKTVVGNFKAYADDFMGGVNVAGADIDKDGFAEVVTAPRQAGGPHVRVFEAYGKVVNSGLLAYESDFRGGVSVAAANVDADSKPEIATIPQKKLVQGRLDLYKYIDVDLSEQTLRAYRNGILEKEFLISSGVASHPTPTGTTTISAKLALHDYEWSYGPNNPDNYDLPDVPWNLRFRQHYYIHNAYWHNNFGHPMSHGCVNASLADSKWIYDWANVGDTVVVHD